MPKTIRIFFVAAAILFLLPKPPAFATTHLTEISRWSAPDHTKIVIFTNKSVKWNIVRSRDPRTMILDITGVSKAPSIREKIPPDDPIVRQVTLESTGDGVRLHIHLFKPANIDVFALRRHWKRPSRIVINVSRPDLVEEELKRQNTFKKLHAEGFKIVLIDPGHGGEDSGAVGSHGTKEKRVVLSIGKEMERILNREKGFKAVLTRSGDYFIPLDERTEMAKAYGGDLFVSLHADWTVKKEVKGSSVYCLSLKGASDKGAELLAEKENLSDLIGGVSVTSENDQLQSILLDLVQTKTINESLMFAGLALKELSKVNKIKYNSPKQAAFVVLKSPDMPSLLVEIAYLSNSDEEKLLNDASFQQRFAKALSSAIIKFLSGDSQKKMTFVKEKASPKKPQKIHIVRKGESLWKIAASHGVSIMDLKRVNRIDNEDHLLPGTKLALP